MAKLLIPSVRLNLDTGLGKPLYMAAGGLKVNQRSVFDKVNWTLSAVQGKGQYLVVNQTWLQPEILSIKNMSSAKGHGP